MELQSEQRIPATQEKVWQALNDTEVLRAAMPGCESFEEVDDNAYQARVTTKVGPVKAKFKFNVTLTDIDPPNAYVIQGEGQGGPAGFARGSASVNLAQEGNETVLSYAVQASVGGKLAQLGGRLIDGTAKKLADEFFTNFIAIVCGEQKPVSPEQESDARLANSNTELKPDKSMLRVYAIAGLVLIAIAFTLFV